MYKLKRFLLVFCMVISTAVLCCNPVQAEEQGVPAIINTEYHQTEARTQRDMINAFRKEKGISEVQYDYELEQIAMKRCSELRVLLKFERPDGTDYKSAYKEAGYLTDHVTENISYGFNTAEECFRWFKESENHSTNMLDEQVNSIGIAYAYINDGYYCVQAYARRPKDLNDTVYTVPVNGTRAVLITVLEKDLEEYSDFLTPAAGWQEDNVGKWYRYEDGTYPAAQWVEITGIRYYFNKEGYLHTGWLKDGGYWYYLSKEGTCTTDWKKVDGTWYYFNENGTMAEEQWAGEYYLNQDGEISTGWKKINGYWYYFNTEGVRTTDWLSIDGDWYFFHEDGRMASSEWEGRYYLNEDGDMAYSTWKKIDGNWYYLQSSGARKTGWFLDEGEWYYLMQDGVMVSNDFRTISGDTYYFRSSGAMVTDWQKINGYWYYFNADGDMVKSKWVGDYYLQEDGIMAADTWIGKYHVNADGKWDDTK